MRGVINGLADDLVMVIAVAVAVAGAGLWGWRRHPVSFWLLVGFLASLPGLYA